VLRQTPSDHASVSCQSDVSSHALRNMLFTFGMKILLQNIQ